MTRLGFKKNNIELCLYTHGEGENVVYLLMYVDDLLICSKNKREIQRVKKLLTNRFEMKDLDEVKEYLGINIDYDYFKNEIRLSQKKYIEYKHILLRCVDIWKSSYPTDRVCVWRETGQKPLECLLSRAATIISFKDSYRITPCLY